MFDTFARTGWRRASHQPSSRVALDVDSIRDTLLYLESDTRGTAGCERLHAAIRAALVEVDGLDRQAHGSSPPQVVSSRFIATAR